MSTRASICASTLRRHVNRHLVAVEVGVEGLAHQRVQLHRLAVDQDGLEGLHAEAVEGGSAIQDHGVLLDHLRQDVPDLGTLALHHLLGRLDGGDEAALLELRVDEGLEQLQRHPARKAALVQPQLRTDDDHRTAGVVHALSEQVLPEASGLPLQHVRQRLERPLAGTGDHAPATAVVEERIHRLLEHPLLVADDHLRRVQLLEPLQPVVAVDDAPVEVVQIAGGETPAVQRDQRSEVRRDHRDHFEDHVLGAVPRLAEGIQHLEALGELLALRLAGRLLHLHAQRLALLLDVQAAEHLADRFGSDPVLEGVPSVLLPGLGELILGKQFALLHAGVAGIDDDVGLEVEHLLEIAERDLQDVPDPRRKGLEEPDVRDRGRQRDVPHALTPDLGLDHLDAALLADHPAVLHPLVLAAVALVVLDRTEDLGAEEAVSFGLERPVVDRLRLLDLAEGPLPDALRRCERDADRVEGQRILGLLEKIVEIAQIVTP